MSALSITLAGQRAAERLMIDACTVERDGAEVTDPETGDVSAAREPIYSGKCKVQVLIARVQDTAAGGHLFVTQRSELHVPMSAGPFKVNDIVTITASVASPFMVGHVFRVAGVQPKTFGTVQRVHVEEIIS